MSEKAESDTGLTILIKSIDIRLLDLPLAEGYDLSFGTVNALSTLLVSVTTASGTGIGEATFLSGYGGETPRRGFEAARRMAEEMVGSETKCTRNRIDEIEVTPFTYSAMQTATKMAGAALEELEVPLVATLPREGAVEAARLFLKRGYREFKYKIGFDPDDDARRVSEVLDIVGDGVLRVDANRGYGREEAEEFLSAFSPGELALLEQPLEEGDDEGHRELREFGTPIMLDEEIRNLRDIERVAKEGSADLVKLKLFKTGSPRELLAAADRAIETGLGVVVGNGVQTGLGCLHEAWVWNRMENAGLAGEMNGFLKMAKPVLKEPPREVEGKLVWSGGPPVLRDDLDRFVVERARFEAG